MNQFKRGLCDQNIWKCLQRIEDFLIQPSPARMTLIWRQSIGQIVLGKVLGTWLWWSMVWMGARKQARKGRICFQFNKTAAHFSIMLGTKVHWGGNNLWWHLSIRAQIGRRRSGGICVGRKSFRCAVHLTWLRQLRDGYDGKSGKSKKRKTKRERELTPGSWMEQSVERAMVGTRMKWSCPFWFSADLYIPKHLRGKS